VDGNAVVVAGGRKLKVLNDHTTIKSLETHSAKLTIPILYELCTAFDLHDETSDLMCRDVEKVVDIRLGKNYVRWYGSKPPRRLAADFAADEISKAQIEVARKYGVGLRRCTVPHEWIALWGFTKRLRRLLADHLKETLLCRPFQR